MGAFVETFKSMLAPAQEAAAETQEQEATAEATEEVTEEASEATEVSEPEDVAKMATFLGSWESRYITGAVLRVDGGMAFG